MIGTFIKKTGKWLFYALLVTTLLLAVAYWSAPYWVPNQVQNFLPEGLKVKQLQLERPGLRSAFINQLELEVAGESELKVQLEDVRFFYSLAQQKLTKIKAHKAQVNFQTNDAENKADFTNQIPIPDLPIEALEIDQLAISGLFIQDLNLQNFSLNNSDDQIKVITQVNFIGLDFFIDSQINHQQQLLEQLTAKISQNEDLIELSLTPDSNKTTSFNWSLNSQLNIKNYYPIDGLSEVKINGEGSFDKSEVYKLSFKPNFSVEIPIDLTALNLKQTTEQLLDSKSIKLDLTNLEAPVLAELNISENSSISFDSQSYLINLVEGSMPLKILHPLTEQSIEIQTLLLNTNFPLSDPQQQISGLLDSKFQLDSLKQQEAGMELTAEELNLQFTAPFKILDSNLELNSQNLFVQLKNSRVIGDFLNTAIDKIEWQGNGIISQSLIGNDKNNLRKIQLKQTSPIDLLLELPEETFNFTALTNSITINNDTLNVTSRSENLQLEQQDFSVNKLQANTNIQVGGEHINGSLTFASSGYKNDQVSIAPLSGDLSWRKKSQAIIAKGKLQYFDTKFPFYYRLNLKTDEHHLAISPLSFAVTDISQWLNPLLQTYPAFTIEKGNITSPRISGNPFELTFDGALKLRDLNLSYDQLKVINLQLDEKLVANSPISGSTNGRIKAIEIASGVAINDLQFYLTHSIDNFLFSDIYGQLLGGSLYIDKLNIDKQKVAPFTVKLNQIDFGKLLQSLDAQTLAIEGLFDFTLPITISDKAQTIVDGTFSSVGKGILQVDSGASAETNIAFQALQNFHYDEFSGVINYSDQGIYQLNLMLKGANPDLYDGFPIELKMTVEGNLPNLLYSMLISGDMAKPIIEKYQSGELDLPQSEGEK